MKTIELGQRVNGNTLVEMKRRKVIEQIANEHHAMIKRIALTHEFAPHLVEELVQDIYLAISAIISRRCVPPNVCGLAVLAIVALMLSTCLRQAKIHLAKFQYLKRAITSDPAEGTKLKMIIQTGAVWKTFGRYHAVCDSSFTVISSSRTGGTDVMFSVIFEVHPKPEQRDNYFATAKMLRPELEKVEGFADNIRYRSLTREGWILSLSSWRDEKAVVRWRTRMRHHEAQERGRTEIFSDYHLRVGQLTKDTNIPEGDELHEQRLDETEVGEGTTLVLIDGKRTSEWAKNTSAEDVARWLGLPSKAEALVNWDVFEAVLTPGDIILLMSWRDHLRAEAFEKNIVLQQGARLRRVRVVRDYGMYDRREAPQYYPPIHRDKYSPLIIS